MRILLSENHGSARKSYAQHLVRLLSGFVTGRVEGDKAQRASPIAAQANVGNLLLLKGAWNDAFLEELSGFPNSGHDDQVDAMSPRELVPDA